MTFSWAVINVISIDWIISQASFWDCFPSSTHADLPTDICTLRQTWPKTSMPLNSMFKFLQILQISILYIHVDEYRDAASLLQWYLEKNIFICITPLCLVHFIKELRTISALIIVLYTIKKLLKNKGRLNVSEELFIKSGTTF